MSWKQRFMEARKTPEKIKPFDEKLYDRYEEMSFIQEIGDSFKLYFRNFPQLVLVFFVVTAIVAIILTFTFTNANWVIASNYNTFTAIYGTDSSLWPTAALTQAASLYNQQLMVQVPQIYISFIPITLSGLMVAKYLIERAKNNKYSLKDSAAVIFSSRHIKTTILFTLLFSGLFALGISFMFVPGIIFMMLLGFSFFKNSEENKGIRGIMKDGYGHGRNFRMKTFVLVVVGIAFFYFAGTYLMRLTLWFYTQADLYSWLNPATRNWPFLLYYNLWNYGAVAFFQPLIFCFLAVQYVEIGVKNENLEESMQEKIEAQSAELQRSSPSEAVDSDGKKIDKKHIAHVIKSQGKEPRFYCPSCGRRLLPTKKQTTVKCSNCGSEVHIILDK